jgi:hypothetical protein
VSNKVDKRKRQRAAAVGGLGCEEQSFNEFPLSFAKFCGLPPLYGNFENVQQKFGQDFAHSQVENVAMRRLY